MDSGTIAAKLAAYDSNPVTSASALNEALGQFGVPEIRNTVSGLRTTVANTTNSLNNVDPSVTGRTQGSLVTEAQRQRQVANERAPIAQELSGETGKLTEQQQALQDALGQATTQANNRVTDYTNGRSALSSQYDIAYKRETDAAAAKAAQDAAARTQANEDRNYQLAVASQRASSAKASTPSAADIKQQDLGTTAQNLMSKAGKDGHVSQETWNKALADWTAAGYSASEFAKNNIQYVNQRYKGYHGYN